ncbi:phenylalanyl-tRNA synthetase alpha chain [Psychromicrobium silvestre]|uniref:Phenylalanyl-tRNA synthetase alpha chain n=1 Tax=Psychromicrobium silvestre TaxID=1645614 RepID=A0A7Y9LTY7_9MICC|nr:hypothetical protein [Psychromicrobium silvestre]NYE95573.1 phenylalanyl-tRNA synthetase alpha chain [Psychromicrobium silvestre]
MKNYLSLTDLNAALAVRDLSDPAAGEHALQKLLNDVVQALETRWRVPSETHRLNPLVATRDNYDRLGYSPGAVTRDSRYSRHVSPTVMLRSHTSAGIPALLDSLRAVEDRYDTLHVLPGLVYRRDAVDRHHVGTPHQVDLWRVKSRGLLGLAELEELMALVAEAVLPGCKWRATPTQHPYTSHGHQLDVLVGGEWLELAECGLIATPILRAAGLEPRRWGGLAMGMGLDRALMLRKGIDDIRLLRSADPRVQSQMLDLQPWRAVSLMPPMRRDLSLVCDSAADVETLGDAARSALGDSAEVLASLEVLANTPLAELPAAAATRLGMVDGQANVLLRLTLQALDRTLTVAEANSLRDRVYLALHEGPVKELIAG